MSARSDGSSYQCCFCGHSITEKNADPVILTFAVGGGGTQELPCHAACLRRVVHASVPLALDDD